MINKKQAIGFRFLNEALSMVHIRSKSILVKLQVREECRCINESLSTSLSLYVGPESVAEAAQSSNGLINWV